MARKLSHIRILERYVKDLSIHCDRLRTDLIKSDVENIYQAIDELVEFTKERKVLRDARKEVNVRVQQPVTKPSEELGRNEKKAEGGTSKASTFSESTSSGVIKPVRRRGRPKKSDGEKK